MKISILLPYKENFSPVYAGAVSLFVKDTVRLSEYKKYINKSQALKAEYKLKNDKVKRKRIKLNFLNKNENFYFTSL